MGVLYLEIDDEITSAAARLRAAAAGPVALVLPAGSHLASSRINFRLLAREAAARGQALAIVSPEAAARALALAAALPAYATVREYEAAAAEGSAAAPGAAAGGPVPTVEAEAPGEEEAAPAAAGARPAAAAALPVVRGEARRGERPSRRRWLAVGLLLLIVAGGGGGAAAYFVVPEARVTVTPRLEAIGPVSFSVTADPEATAVDAAAGIVPAERPTLRVEASGTYEASGVRVDETKASGVARFRSENTLFDVTVPAGTRLSTASGAGFVTTAAAVVPKASFATGPTARDVTIEAIDPGPAGNVPAGAITREPSTLAAALVTVSNPSATTGGSRTEVKLIAQEDYDAAVVDLQAKLDEAFRARLVTTTTTPEGSRIFPDTARLGAATFDPEPAVVGSEAESFILVARANGRASAVDLDQIDRLGAERLRGEVASGLVLLEDSPKVEWSPGGGSDPSQVVFEVTAQGSGYRRIDAAALKAAIVGRPLGEALGILAGYGEARVELTPDWFGRIPSLDFRVVVEVAPVPEAP